MKSKNKNTIAEHDLSPLAKAGIFVSRFENRDIKDDHVLHIPHRDTHYLLILAETGSFQFHLDFQELNMEDPTMVIIFPGQVHHISSVENGRGWSIGFDPTLVPASLQLCLEAGLNNPFPLDLSGIFFQQAAGILTIIAQIHQGPVGPLRSQTVRSLLNALLALIAEQLQERRKTLTAAPDRIREIERSFQSLLKKNFVNWKQPSKYAAELAISPAHLNDTVRAITGKSVTAHIQQMNILEAKRLLYRTDLSIKEIGYQLGYEDPVHFGKLFKKLTGTTPLAFRKEIRE